MFLTDDQKQTVNVLFNIISILESKRPYAIGHSKRVAELSRQVAEEFDLDEDSVDRIFVAGLLHDIGYLALPDRVFQTSEPLGEAERELLRTHSKVGIHILGKASYLIEIRDIILQHHHRFDGRDNPDGAKGREIPLGARIIHLVETFEALTKARPHRAALPVLKAFEAIREDQGRFDPELVEAFVKVLEKRLGGPLTITISQEEMNQRLNQARARVMKQDRPAPVSPESLGYLERLLREDKATFAQISRVLELEPSLAGEVVRVANSDLYEGDYKITKVSEALVRVGLGEARDILSAFIYRNILRGLDPDFRSLFSPWWEHGLMTGVACQGLAAKGAQEQVNTAFLLGLLHAIGKPCLLKEFTKDWPGGQLGPDHQTTLLEYIDRNHRVVGENVLSKAGIREPFQKAIRSHGLSNAGGLAPESLLLNAAADVVMVIRSGEGVKATNFQDLVSIALLGLLPQDVEEVAQETIRRWDSIRRVFPGLDLDSAPEMVPT